jgi:hypothetical protein
LQTWDGGGKQGDGESAAVIYGRNYGEKGKKKKKKKKKSVP